MAEQLADYVAEYRAPFVRDFKGAARRDREGTVPVIFSGRLADTETHLSDYGASVVFPATGAEPENPRYAAPVDALLVLGRSIGRKSRVFSRFFRTGMCPN